MWRLPLVGWPASLWYSPRRLTNLLVVQWEQVSRTEACLCGITPAVQQLISGLASCLRFYCGAPGGPLRGT